MTPTILTSILLVAIALQLGAGAPNEFRIDRDIEILSKATIQIIKHYYSKRASGLSLIRLAWHTRTYYKQSEVINRVLLYAKSEVSYVLEEPKYMKFSPFLRFDAIIFLDSYEAFREFYEEASIKTVHYAGFFTIILTEYIGSDKITAIFNDCWKRHTLNINVLRLDRIKDHVNVYTYFPFSHNNCERIESRLLMTLSNTTAVSLVNNHFFRNKLRNFHKCPLWLATYNVPPYMILRELNNSESPTTYGIEGNLYRELSKSLNFKPMVRIGKPSDNFAMLKKGNVNLTMSAAINTAERSKKFTASFPYFYTSVVFTTPHGSPFTPLQKLILPFQPMLWTCMLSLTVISLTVIVHVSNGPKHWRDLIFGEKNRSPFLNFINIALGGVITQEPVRNFPRMLLLIWCLSSMVLRSSYQGALFSSIQSQKSAVDIDSLDKLVQFNYTIYSSGQILRLLEFGSPQISKNLKMHDDSFDIMESVKDPEFHGSFVTTDDFIGWHNLLYFNTSTIRPSKQRIFLLPLSLFMEKHSCLETIINQQIELLYSNGLIEKWSNVYRDKLMIARKRPKQSPKKLRFGEVSGAYKLCTFLYGISTILFIGEIVSVKVGYLRKLFDHV